MAKGNTKISRLNAKSTFRDEELATIRGMAVNEKGVGLSDAYWQNWYNAYKNDTLDANASLVVISNFFDMAKAKKKKA